MMMQVPKAILNIAGMATFFTIMTENQSASLNPLTERQHDPPNKTVTQNATRCDVSFTFSILYSMLCFCTYTSINSSSKNIV